MSTTQFIKVFTDISVKVTIKIRYLGDTNDEETSNELIKGFINSTMKRLLILIKDDTINHIKVKRTINYAGNEFILTLCPTSEGYFTEDDKEELSQFVYSLILG